MRQKYNNNLDVVVVHPSPNPHLHYSMDKPIVHGHIVTIVYSVKHLFPYVPNGNRHIIL